MPIKKLTETEYREHLRSYGVSEEEITMILGMTHPKNKKKKDLSI